MVSETINTGVILLAAGEGKRFGGNKLLAECNGRKLFQYAVDAVVLSGLKPLIIVTGYEEIKDYCIKQGFRVVMNNEPERGISQSVRIGMKELLLSGKDSEADIYKQGTDVANSVIFGVCDQPGVKPHMFTKLVQTYRETGMRLIGTEYRGEPGNPCLFDKRYYKELMELQGDSGGRQVFKRHPEDVYMVEAESMDEVVDIDYRDDDRIKRGSAEMR